VRRGSQLFWRVIDSSLSFRDMTLIVLGASHESPEFVT
jgi:hypothetical protein